MPWHRVVERDRAVRYGAVGWNPPPTFSRLTRDDGAVWWARNNEPTNDMKLNEIKAAVLAGKVVHWKNGAYRVIFDPTRGSVVAGFLIECVLNGDCIGLTWTNGVTMNGEEADFFIATDNI
jgi:hypothetical protein